MPIDAAQYYVRTNVNWKGQKKEHDKIDQTDNRMDCSMHLTDSYTLNKFKTIRIFI